MTTLRHRIADRHSIGASVQSSSRQRPTERVYEMLRRDVAAQKFGLGQRLMINDLASRYSVSITPIREALSRLRGERLIGFESGEGYYCKIPHLDELQDLYALLEKLLSFAIEQTARANRPRIDVRPKLDQTVPVDSAITLVTDGPLSENARAIESALEQVAMLCSNEEVLLIVQDTLTRTHFMRMTILEQPGRAEMLIAKLQSLTLSLEQEDPRRSGALLQDYLRAEFLPLPDLLRDLIALPYLSHRRSVEDIHKGRGIRR